MTPTAPTFKGPDGRDYISVDVGKSKPFAQACLVEWRRQDGKNRMWMIRQKVISVPAEIIPLARARVEKQHVVT